MEHGITSSDGPVASTRPRARASFSQVEWTVIAISRNDPLSGLARPSPAKRFFKQIIGIQERASFAAPRLEALRRMAIALRAEHEDYVISEEAQFYAAGFQPEDLVYLTAIVDADDRSVRQQTA